MATSKEYNQRYYLLNREKILERNRRWRERNKERHLASAREYHQTNREKILQQKRDRLRANTEAVNARRRDKKFGLPAGKYEAMLAAQKGCCDICGKRGRLVVDHDHQTQEVRALLCSPCNTAIGLLKEDAGLVWRAFEYVVAHRRAA